MSKLSRIRYTLVQHSAWAARQNETFRNAVEPAGVSTHAELGRVVDAGGLVFDDYTEADEAADKVNQPALDAVLYPDQVTDSKSGDLHFDETFAIGGRSLYVPLNGAAADKAS